MNRYIAVPSAMCIDGKIPSEAIRLAGILSIEIKTIDDCDVVHVANEPSIRQVSYSPVYSIGKIWDLDIVDEFLDMTTGVKLLIDGQEYEPKVQERHAAKFRIRLHCGGKKQIFLVAQNEQSMIAEIEENRES